MSNINSKKKKKETKKEDSSIFETISAKDIDDAWKTDFSGFEYSGTAVGTTTSTPTMTSVFEKEDKKFLDEWKEKRKETTHCDSCGEYFYPPSDTCPKCGKKFTE